VKPYSILFVCTGNICRSPTAEGVMLKKVRERGWSDWLSVDSAGTHGYHVGEAPDARSQAHAARRGYDLADLRARRVAPADFERFDQILAMDDEHLELLHAQCPPRHAGKLEMMMSHARRHKSEIVPDPYFGGDAGFEEVLDYVEDACDGLLDAIAAKLPK
jgi:protein-tyrosine phosphatase